MSSGPPPWCGAGVSCVRHVVVKREILFCFLADTPTPRPPDVLNVGTRLIYNIIIVYVYFFIFFRQYDARDLMIETCVVVVYIYYIILHYIYTMMIPIFLFFFYILL